MTPWLSNSQPPCQRQWFSWLNDTQLCPSHKHTHTQIKKTSHLFSCTRRYGQTLLKNITFCSMGIFWGGHHGNRHWSANCTNVHNCLPMLHLQLQPLNISVRQYLGVVCYMWQDGEAPWATASLSERAAHGSVEVLISHCETTELLGLCSPQLWDARAFVRNGDSGFIKNSIMSDGAWKPPPSLL